MAIDNAPIDKLIEKTASELKKIEGIEAPEWAKFVKTGAHKERRPVDRDWWYTRSAAILRKVYKLGPIGTSKLRVKFGGNKSRGHKPSKFYKGSGNIIRTILQQLETAGFVKQTKKEAHHGRVLSPKGQSFLNSISKELSKKE
ncbi:30S ribosomal protein S19e [archaeon]|jgi:small subunit ribosomal protein S19e|nr:30S ribosomal protein S19e [archaeon]